MHPSGDKHFMRCSILTANKDCCENSSAVHSNIFSDKNPNCDGQPGSTLVKTKTVEVTVEGCARSSRSVEPEFSETPEIEIPNDVAELMDDFEPEKLEMCYGTECINLDNSDIKIRPAQSDCTVRYEQCETCAAVTKTHNTDKIMQGLVYTMIALIGSLVTLTVFG